VDFFSEEGKLLLDCPQACKTIANIPSVMKILFIKDRNKNWCVKLKLISSSNIQQTACDIVRKT
jgi:hypothetical protein